MLRANVKIYLFLLRFLREKQQIGNDYADVSRNTWLLLSPLAITALRICNFGDRIKKRCSIRNLREISHKIHGSDPSIHLKPIMCTNWPREAFKRTQDR